MSLIQHRRPRFERASNPAAFQVTDRDVEIIRQVARHRFLRSTHVSGLLEAPHKKILERLGLLYHAGYLDRPRAQLEYHVLGGGSAPLVYALGNRGAQLLAECSEHQKVVDWSQKNRDTGREFILHTLAISDFRVALTMSCRAHSSLILQGPDELLETLPAHTRSASRPWSWRVRVQHGSQHCEIGVVPDFVFAILFPGGKRRVFMVECDNGTMPVERSTLAQTSMLRKLLAYQATRNQALHTYWFGWRDFRVLFVTNGSERASNVSRLIKRTSTLTGSPVFLIADRAALGHADILNTPWRGVDHKPHTLA